MIEPASHSPRRLLFSTAIALGVAAVLLLLCVLPAEYGIDPTGIGARIGLQQMSAAAEEEEEPEAAVAAEPIAIDTNATSVLDALWKSPTPFRTDEMSLTLRPDEGAELKAKMRAGERFVFAWEALDGVVTFDMHGDAVGAAEGDFTSYLKGRNAGGGNGSFTAPFAGNHGWYWRNRTQQTVTIRLRTTGFYEKLFKP